jgi:hypothetical protein
VHGEEAFQFQQRQLEELIGEPGNDKRDGEGYQESISLIHIPMPIVRQLQCEPVKPGFEGEVVHVEAVAYAAQPRQRSQ